MAAAQISRLLARSSAVGAAALLIAAVGASAGPAAASGRLSTTRAADSRAPAITSRKRRSKSKPGGKPATKPVLSTPAFYALKNPSAKCRPNYTKQRITISVRKHHRTVRTHQTRCVYTGSSDSNGATVSFPTDLPTAGITVNVIPGADDADYTVAADDTLSVGGAGVLSGEHDGELTATVVTTTKHGTLTLNRDGSFRYVPDASFSGLDSFTYRTVSPADESSAPATVTIHVTPVAIAVANYGAPVAGTLSISAPGVLTGDIGTGLHAKLVSAPHGGTLTLNADGSFTYSASPSFSGPDSFSFEAVDSSGQDSGAVTVTIDVGAQPPVVYPQTFSGAIGNTELAVGGSPGSGPEVYLDGESVFNADVDPAGGTLSASPATITTSQGGTVTLAADGSFIYEPPVGFDGPSDSFNYQVDTSEGTGAQATATIGFDTTRVWYVNSSAPAGGDGSSIAPFNSLASVNTPGGVSGPGDVIFLYDGAGDYSGGLTLAGDQTLVGQSQGLTVDSEQLLAASGANPVITNSGGAGVSLADGDTIDGVSVAGTSGDGVSVASGASVKIEGDSAISSAGGDGIDAVNATSLSVSTATISASAGNGIDASGAGAVTVTDSTIDGSAADGILIDNTSVSSTTDAFNLVNNQLDGARGSAISITYAGNAAGFVDGNLIGNGSDTDSGSATGDGISVTADPGTAGPLLAEIDDNTVNQIGEGTGIDALTSGTGALQLTLVGNTVTMSSSASQNGVTVAAGSGGASAALCLNPSANVVTAAGTGTPTDGLAVEQLAPASTFAIEGLPNGASISTVESYLTSVDGTLVGAGGGFGSFAEQSGGNGFTATTCLAPAYNI